MELKEIKVKKWMIILDIVIIILSTLIILFCVGNAFYSRINKRVELVHVDKIEVVGRHTFWFHTLPNITRVFNCTRGE